MNLSHYTEDKPHFFKRVCWTIINNTIFRWLPGMSLRYVRNIFLIMFGAKIPLRCYIYSSCKIWGPWNLQVGKYCCIGPNTRLYNRAPIILKDNVVVSQGSYLCTASHDITDPKHAVVMKPIILENSSWVAADAFIGMGVIIGEGAVVGARGCVFKNVEPWTVVGGNPAKFIKRRYIKDTI